MHLKIGFSPCPNDTFIFDALVNGRIETEGISFQPLLEDVEQLNLRAINGEADVTKLSFGVYAKVAHQYQILDSGAALGKNCGPLLVVKKDFTWKDLPGLTVAIPGRNTTANLLLSIFAPEVKNKKEILFSEIEDAVINGEADAGLIIHESRFTYEAKGLKKIADMGELWEQYTGSPIPLGCIAIRRSLPEEIKDKVNTLVRNSVLYAFENPDQSREYIQRHAAEMSEEVQRRHIALYVNEYSVDLGNSGRKSVELLFRKGAETGLLPVINDSVFLTQVKHTV